MAGDPDIVILVVPGGTADVEAFLVGQLRELRADESNDSLRLHDGVKEGGYEFLNRDQSDARYQPRAPELDGFDFGAQEKGYLVRVGPAAYKIRRLVSESGDITIANPAATAANTDIRIADEVETRHTWNDIQTFIERIVAIDGLTGNTYGTHYGDVIGNVTGNLEGDAHGDHSGTFTGDVNVSGHQFVTDDGQILEEQIDPQAWIRRGVPEGAILMWSGSVAGIPASWHLCDGTSGTPDLRNRFIYGAGTGIGFSAPGATGGSLTAGGGGTIGLGGAHSHPLTIDGHALTIDEMPAHDHGNGVTNTDDDLYCYGSKTCPTTSESIDDNSSDGVIQGITEEIGGGAAHSHTGATTDSGEHTHDLTLDDVSVMPPYYALCYIMKIV